MGSLESIRCKRAEFSLPDGLHYLNCAYMGPLPRRVQEAGFAGVRRKADPSRIVASDFFQESDHARSLFARLVNAPDPQRIAIIPAASYGIAIVARNTPVSRGQNVVISAEQFPSNTYSWRTLSERRGLELRAVQPPQTTEGRGREWNARLLEAIDQRTAIVALPHVHWTDGTRFDLAALGARAREVGAAFIVDATQSVGALPFDVQQFMPDALVVAGYKWLLGPYSIGAAYFGERYDQGEPLEENWIGRAGSEDFRALVNYADEFQPGALRYDVGERSNFALMPMFIAALELILEWQPARIQSYCAQLTREPLRRAAEFGFVIEDAEWRGAHLFGVRAPPHVDLARLHQELQLRNIFASLRGSALRVSPNVYNDAADIFALLEVLNLVATSAGNVAARP
jgi:selenocysteine lyase/cysteine desulfurase